MPGPQGNRKPENQSANTASAKSPKIVVWVNGQRVIIAYKNQSEIKAKQLELLKTDNEAFQKYNNLKEKQKKATTVEEKVEFGKQALNVLLYGSSGRPPAVMPQPVEPSSFLKKASTNTATANSASKPLPKGTQGPFAANNGTYVPPKFLQDPFLASNSPSANTPTKSGAAPNKEKAIIGPVEVFNPYPGIWDSKITREDYELMKKNPNKSLQEIHANEPLSSRLLYPNRTYHDLEAEKYERWLNSPAEGFKKVNGEYVKLTILPLSNKSATFTYKTIPTNKHFREDIANSEKPKNVDENRGPKVNPFDGYDNPFPHSENELLKMEAHSDKTFYAKPKDDDDRYEQWFGVKGSYVRTHRHQFIAHMMAADAMQRSGMTDEEIADEFRDNADYWNEMEANTGLLNTINPAGQLSDFLEQVQKDGLSNTLQDMVGSQLKNLDVFGLTDDGKISNWEKFRRGVGLASMLIGAKSSYHFLREKSLTSPFLQKAIEFTGTGKAFPELNWKNTYGLDFSPWIAEIPDAGERQFVKGKLNKGVKDIKSGKGRDSVITTGDIEGHLRSGKSVRSLFGSDVVAEGAKLNYKLTLDESKILLHAQDGLRKDFYEARNGYDELIASARREKNRTGKISGDTEIALKSAKGKYEATRKNFNLNLEALSQADWDGAYDWRIKSIEELRQQFNPNQVRLELYRQGIDPSPELIQRAQSASTEFLNVLDRYERQLQHNRKNWSGNKKVTTVPGKDPLLALWEEAGSSKFKLDQILKSGLDKPNIKTAQEASKTVSKVKSSTFTEPISNAANQGLQYVESGLKSILQATVPGLGEIEPFKLTYSGEKPSFGRQVKGDVKNRIGKGIDNMDAQAYFLGLDPKIDNNVNVILKALDQGGKILSSPIKRYVFNRAYESNLSRAAARGEDINALTIREGAVRDAFGATQEAFLDNPTSLGDFIGKFDAVKAFVPSHQRKLNKLGRMFEYIGGMEYGALKHFDAGRFGPLDGPAKQAILNAYSRGIIGKTVMQYISSHWNDKDGMEKTGNVLFDELQSPSSVKALKFFIDSDKKSRWDAWKGIFNDAFSDLPIVKAGQAGGVSIGNFQKS